MMIKTLKSEISLCVKGSVLTPLIFVLDFLIQHLVFPDTAHPAAHEPCDACEPTVKRRYFSIVVIYLLLSEQF